MIGVSSLSAFRSQRLILSKANAKARTLRLSTILAGRRTKGSSARLESALAQELPCLLHKKLSWHSSSCHKGYRIFCQPIHPSKRNFSSSTSMAIPPARCGSLDSPVRQSPDEVHTLLKAMGAGAGSKSSPKFKVKKSNFRVAGTDITVSGWKFSDWDYKKRILPTYARGLFTYRDDASGNHEIVVRGYDKFFNIGEVPQTKWNWIKENTKPPYDLTLKENGCIIFLSGLPNGKLLVCSKHSTGVRTDVEESHAMVGERWVEKHLASVGKTKEDLAMALRELNATAVAELCDDSFEEHILPYEKERAGLYLHGINFNVPIFATCSSAEVQKFAEQWGFIKTDYFTMDSPEELKKFLEEAAETGSWEGKDVEGFVIRCKARHGPTDSNWHDWFFKYKFDEPYLMYRQWRECTKSMLSGKTPNPKKHIKVTKEYLAFAKRYFLANPNAPEQYKKNHGIISLREAFLRERGVKGSDLVKEDEQGARAIATKDVRRDLVLVPVATIGCGKTTVAIALSRLFNWGHVQNDNITGKARGPEFVKRISQELMTHKAAIADRNNHMRRERQQLISDLKKVASDVTYVALHYNHYPEGVDMKEYQQQIREVTTQRVFQRGDKHQTIQASSQDKVEVLSIMTGFLKRFEPLDTESAPDSFFDMVIELDVLADSRTNLETIVKNLSIAYPAMIPKPPTPEEYDAAIQYALNEYQPDIKHKVKSSASTTIPVAQQFVPSQGNLAKAKKTEYFAIQVPKDIILEALESTFSMVEPSQKSFYDHLKRTNRIQDAFHVTLIHRASLGSQKKIWEHYENLLHLNGKGDHSAVLDKSKVKFKSIVWDGRCMAIPVEFLAVNKEAPPCVNVVPHITIGTGNPTIKPKEANDMLMQWKRDKGFKITEFEMEKEIVLEGDVKAVPAR